MFSENKKKLIEKISAVLLALILWHVAAKAMDSTLLLASPESVVVRLWSLLGEAQFYSAVGFSLIRIIMGFLLGLGIGCILAAAAARFHAVEVILWPYITIIKTTPVASFIILCLVWLKAKNLSVFISFLMVLPVVYTNMLTGIRNTDRKLLEMARLFRVGFCRQLRYIYLPQLRPYITAACTVSLGLAWKAGIAAEVIGIPDGSIGEMLYEAKVYLNTPELFAWTVVVIVVSILFEKLFLRLLQLCYERIDRHRRVSEVEDG